MKRLIVVALILAMAALVAIAMPPPSNNTNTMVSAPTAQPICTATNPGALGPTTVFENTAAFAPTFLNYFISTTDIGGCTANGINTVTTVINSRAGRSYLQGQPFVIPEPATMLPPEGVRKWLITSLYTGKVHMSSSIAFSTVRERRTRTC